MSHFLKAQKSGSFYKVTKNCHISHRHRKQSHAFPKTYITKICPKKCVKKVIFFCSKFRIKAFSNTSISSIFHVQTRKYNFHLKKREKNVLLRNIKSKKTTKKRPFSAARPQSHQKQCLTQMFSEYKLIIEISN